jgi:GDP-4-dehydro-6-deoxy-D-mannose reductase
VNVLVTGAGGFVGQHLVKALVARGYEVVGGTLAGELPTIGVLTAEEIESVRWHELDVTDDDQVNRVVEIAAPTWVFHLAGQSSVGSSFGDVIGTWQVNATGTLRLLVAIGRNHDARSRVVVASSGEVYGAVPEREQPIHESRAPAPSSPYAASKLAAEVAVLQLSRSGAADAVIARSFNHTGPGQSTRFALASWAEQLSLIATRRSAARLQVGNLAVRRDWLDVRDVVAAYLLLAECGRNGEIYNVCSGAARSLEDLARMMIELTGTQVELSEDPTRLRPADIPLLTGDPGRLQSLGWKMTVPLRETLRDLLADASEAG